MFSHKRPIVFFEATYFGKKARVAILEGQQQLLCGWQAAYVKHSNLFSDRKGPA